MDKNTLKMIVDLVFSTLEEKYAGHVFVLYVIKFMHEEALKLIDSMVAKCEAEPLRSTLPVIRKQK